MTGRGGHITIGGKTVAVTEWGMTRSRPTPTDLDLLLAAVIEEPDEDTPRLAYADALVERGGPGDAERAEFVRCQIRLLRMSGEHALDAERDEVRRWLLRYIDDGHLAVELDAGPDWYWSNCEYDTEIVAGGWEFRVRRGFVESVTCSAADWIAHADALLAAHPVRRVALTTWPADVYTWDFSAVDPADPSKGQTSGMWPRVEFALPPHEVAYVGEDVTLAPHALANAVAAGRLGIAIGDWHTTGPGSPFATTAPRDPPPTTHTPPEE